MTFRRWFRNQFLERPLKRLGVFLRLYRLRRFEEPLVFLGIIGRRFWFARHNPSYAARARRVSVVELKFQLRIVGRQVRGDPPEPRLLTRRELGNEPFHR